MTDEHTSRRLDPAAVNMPPVGDWPIDPPRALLAAGICWGLFALVVVLALTGKTVAIDTLGLEAWRSGPDLAPRGPGWLLEAVRDLTGLGGVLLRHLCAVGALTALLFLGRKRNALILAATVAGGWLLNSLVKILVGRERPTIVPHLTEASGNSFPSGHSFNSAVVFLAIALAFAALTPRRRVRWTIIGSAIALTWAIAFSRVWLGVHFPSDVIAGWLGGAGWAFLAAGLLDRPSREAMEPQR